MTDILVTYDFHKNHGLILDKEFYNKKGLSGIINTGNKCYSNSILQCLSHTLKLTDYFLSNKYQNDNIESNFRKKKSLFLDCCIKIYYLIYGNLMNLNVLITFMIKFYYFYQNIIIINNMIRMNF